MEIDLISLSNLSKSELDNPKVKDNIKKEIQKIITNINELGIKIDESKEEAKQAQSQRTGWFGKTSKKTDMIANALVKNAEADAEMHTLIQSIIKFSCLSTYAYHIALQEMSGVIQNGFKNNDGDIINLNNTAKDIVEGVIYSVQEANKTNEKHLKLENESNENDERHDRQIAELYEKIKELQGKKYNLLAIISIVISLVAIFLVLFKEFLFH